MIDFSAVGLAERPSYRLVTGVMTPRPIAFVSTVSPEGVRNIAPFSWCNVVSTQPPLVSLTVGSRPQAPDGRKDTLRNIETGGGFVVNIVPVDIERQMVETSAYWARDDDEFARCGLTPVASECVLAPRLAESPLSLECQLDQVLRVVEGPDLLVIGQVVRIHLADHLASDALLLGQVLRTGRLAGTWYVRPEELRGYPGDV